MKKSTMAVATLLSVLSAPVVSVAYADDMAPTATLSCHGCEGCAGHGNGCQGCAGQATCKGSCAGE